MGRFQYFLWAVQRCFTTSTVCPACGSNSKLLRRKYLVTALRECPVCGIRFRTPQDDRASAERFYKEETYKQGFTTDLPSQDDLQKITEAASHIQAEGERYPPAHMAMVGREAPLASTDA